MGGFVLGNYPKVMIGCPVGIGRSYILPTYLSKLTELDYPKNKIHIALLFNYPKSEGQVAVPHTAIKQPSIDKSEIQRIRGILKKFKRKTRRQYDKVTIHEYQGNYEDRLIQGRRALGRWMEYFAELRNKWIGMRRPQDQYIFSVDSDILIPKHSLKSLISHKKPIVSMLLANGPISDPYISPNLIDNFLLPYTTTYPGVNNDFIMRAHAAGQMAFNVMMKYSRIKSGRDSFDNVNYRHVHPAELHVREIQNYDRNIYYDNLRNIPELGPWTVPQRYGDLCDVDMTGAAYLIRKDVLDAGVVYGYHHQGEDCHFSAMAQDKGFSLHCDYNVRADHIMNEEIWNGYLQSKAMRVVGFKPPKGETFKPPVEEEKTVSVVLDKVGNI